MTAATIFLVTILMITSINGIIFISKYLTLTRQGVKTDGRIVAIDISRFIMNKNATVPKVSFVTFDQKVITNKPMLSWLFSVNGYLPQKDCIVYYDKKIPEKFILKSNSEILINILVIVTTAVILTYFFLTKL